MTTSTRVSTFAMHNMYVSNMLTTQGRLDAAMTQVNTGMKSQTYAGLGNTSFRLVNMETQRTEAEHYMASNIAIDLRLSMMQTSMEAMRKTTLDFRNQLITYHEANSGDTAQVPDQAETDEIQRWAWNAMEQMKDYLNTKVDGQYLYAGAKTQTKPVALEDTLGNTLASLDDFQNVYNNTNAYPSSRDTNLTSTATHIAYYNGDNQKLSYRVDGDREIEMGITATDAAFEKAMRAMAMIAQGPTDTVAATSGLDANVNDIDTADWQARVEEALWLLGDALNADTMDRVSPVNGNTEGASDFESIERITGFNQSIVKQTTTEQRSYISFLNAQTDDIEKVDMAGAIVRMQDEQRALQASYSTISMAKDLSLVNYMR